MPEFHVEFVEKTNSGVQTDALPAFEAYGELIDTLTDASDYAAHQGFKAIRVYLHADDSIRLEQQFRNRFPKIKTKEYAVKSQTWGHIDVYQANDTAQPGNAMMVIQRH